MIPSKTPTLESIKKALNLFLDTLDYKGLTVDQFIGEVQTFLDKNYGIQGLYRNYELGDTTDLALEEASDAYTIVRIVKNQLYHMFYLEFDLELPDAFGFVKIHYTLKDTAPYVEMLPEMAKAYLEEKAFNAFTYSEVVNHQYSAYLNYNLYVTGATVVN